MVDKKPPNMKWEDFSEQLIREAQQSGQFDDIPIGKRLENIDDPNDDNWWIRNKLKEEQLTALPPGLQLQLDVQKAREELLTISQEETLRRRIRELNVEIRERLYCIAWGPPANVFPVDEEAFVKKWDALREKSE